MSDKAESSENVTDGQGDSPRPAPTTSAQAPTPAPPAAPPADQTAPAAAPPSAVIVANGALTEREIELAKKLEAEAARARKAETDAAYLADENQRLKAAGLRPAPAVKAKTTWTLFDE